MIVVDFVRDRFEHSCFADLFAQCPVNTITHTGNQPRARGHTMRFSFTVKLARSRI